MLKGFNRSVVINNSQISHLNKENEVTATITPKESLDEKKLRAKEQEDQILEYMGNMDETKKRSLLSQLENFTIIRPALKPIDDNNLGRGKFSLDKKPENGNGTSMSMVSPMEVSEAMKPQSSNSCQ